MIDDNILFHGERKIILHENDSRAMPSSRFTGNAFITIHGQCLHHDARAMPSSRFTGNAFITIHGQCLHHDSRAMPSSRFTINKKRH
jgi:hypothetical protein